MKRKPYIPSPDELKEIKEQRKEQAFHDLVEKINEELLAKPAAYTSDKRVADLFEANGYKIVDVTSRYKLGERYRIVIP